MTTDNKFCGEYAGNGIGKCQRYDINDRIALTSIRTHRFKTGMLAFSLTLPLTKRTSTLNLLLCGVIRRGTQKYVDMARINRRLDELYAASIDIRPCRYGNNEMLLLCAEMLDEAYSLDGTDIAGGVADIMLQMLYHPLLDADGLFAEKWFNSEKKNTIDSLKAEINNTRSYATMRCSEIMHRADGEYPTLDDMIKNVTEITCVELTDYYKKIILSSHIDAFYVGSLSGEIVAEKIRADIRTDTLPFVCRENRVVPLCTGRGGDRVDTDEEMPVSQGKLAIGLHTGICVGSDDYYATVVFNEIFGGSPASKLFMNVREKMSLCYYCSSSYNMYNGIIIVSSGIDVQNRQKAQDAIFEQLADIREGRISDTELLSAKKSLENWYRQIDDNPFELHGFYSGRAVFGIADTVAECREKISRVTRDDVIRVASGISTDTVYFLRGTLPAGAEDDRYEQ